MEGGGSRFTFRNALAMAQVALSLVLLMGAGLLVRTLQNLSHADLGYRRDHLLVANLDFGVAGYQDAKLVDVYKRLFEKLNTTPGVTSATYSMNGLLSGSDAGDDFTIEDYHPGRDHAQARFEQVGPNYFGTVGIPLISGRDITSSDDERAPKVAVVNQAFVKRFFAKSEALANGCAMSIQPDRAQLSPSWA